MKIPGAIQGCFPVIAIVVYQIMLGGSSVLYKVAANDGMSLPVLIAYRFLLSAIFLDVVAFFVERGIRPKMNWTVVWQSFLGGLLWFSVAHNLYAASMVVTSATFASAMFNLVPAMTFSLAVIFGLEKLVLETRAGKAKVIGTLICIGGAMAMTFIRGVKIHLWPQSIDLLHKYHQGNSHHQDIFLGSLMVIGDCVSSSLGLIVQAKLLKNYPCTYSVAALMTSMAALQSVLFAVCWERSHWSQWKLERKIRLFSVIYNGIVASGIAFILSSWCVRVRGPVFVAIFNPIMLVSVAIIGSVVLQENLYIGSVVGAVIIVVGLYLVLWGKRKESKSNAKPVNSVKSDDKLIEVVVASNKQGNPNELPSLSDKL